MDGTGSTEEAAAAESTHVALTGALSEADEALAELRAGLQRAHDAEAAEANAARIAELHTERGRLQAEHHASRVAADEYLHAVAVRLTEIASQFIRAGREIESLAPAVRITTSAAGQLKETALEYGEAIGTAQRTLSNQLDRQQRKKAQAA